LKGQNVRPGFWPRRLGVRQLVLLVVAVGLAWRLGRFAIGFPIWGDEASLAMNLLLRDFAGMLRPPLEYRQMAPVGFMWVQLALSKVFGINDWSMRLFSLLCGVGALLLFWLFAKKLLDRRGTLLAVAIMAASYYPVRHTSEFKPYASDMLVGLLLTMGAWHVSRRPSSAVRWILLIAGSAVAVWLSFPSAFVIGGLGVFLVHLAVRAKHLGALGGLAVLGLVTGLSFLAMFLIYAGPHAAASPHYMVHSSWRWSFPPFDRPWLLPWWLLDVHTGNMLAYPIGGKNFGSVATFILVAIGCVMLWRRGRRGLLLLLLGALPFMLIAASLKRYPYGTSARTTLFMAPAFCLLAGVGLHRCIRFAPQRLRARLLRTAALLLAALALAGLTSDIVRPYKRLGYYQTRAAIAKIARQTSPQDQWVVGNSTPEHDTADYARPDDSQATLTGRGNVVFRYYTTSLAKVPLYWGATAQEAPVSAGRTWLLFYVDPKFCGEEYMSRYEELLADMTARLGEPRHQRFTVERAEKNVGHPMILVNEFPAPRKR
jgi:hypothetical protein